MRSIEMLTETMAEERRRKIPERLRVLGLNDPIIAVLISNHVYSGCSLEETLVTMVVAESEAHNQARKLLLRQMQLANRPMIIPHHCPKCGHQFEPPIGVES